MKEKFNVKNGEVIKIVNEAIGKRVKDKATSSRDKQRNVTKKNVKYGKLKTNDLKNITYGLDIFSKIVGDTLTKKELENLSGKKDISKLQKDVVGYKNVINNSINKLRYDTNRMYDLMQELDDLKDYSEIIQAARDGVLTKKETTQTNVNGKNVEKQYDTSMTPREVVSILQEYKRQADLISHRELNNYLAIGLGLAGIIGTLSEKDTENQTDKKSKNIITIGTIIATGVKLIQGTMKKNENKELYELTDMKNSMKADWIENEQVSSKAGIDTINQISDISKKELKKRIEIENKGFAFNIALELAVAIISGMYINQNIKIKENGKIDGASLATAIVSLQRSKGLAGYVLETALGMQTEKKEKENFERLCEKVNEIFEQMHTKVYPLEGAKSPFDSINIQNLDAKFYPKTNYETGDVEFETKLSIPEFSMKRGDVVLLSGNSGAGKSTFLRLLKRGDINNRNCITLDNKDKVDHLGNQCISFKPSMNLGNESNVLYQLTGKSNPSDLTDNEKAKLENILKELNLEYHDILEKLSTKKFMEFSTGQQRRLALSKLFYRIDDGTSTIIVDEPVGNVQDDLLREQLEMIKRYAKEKNVMLLITTHRLEVAKDLATKRYHIDDSGNLAQIPIASKQLNKGGESFGEDDSPSI